MTAVWPTLAAGGVNAELIRVLIVVFVMIIGTIIKRINDRKEQIERAKAAAKPQPPPLAPPRDNRFKNEIEVFLDEVGRRGNPGDRSPGSDTPRMPARPDTPRERDRAAAQRAELAASSAARPPQSSKRQKPAPAKTEPPRSPKRPGADMAARKAPMSDDLGLRVRAHLSQYLDASRLPNQVQADIGNAVDRMVREHLGQPITHGTAEKEAATARSTGHPIISLLRDGAGVRNAMVISEILGRPRGMQRRT